VFACDGGNTQTSFEQKIFPDFAKKYGGVKLTYVPGQPADNIAKLRVQKNQPAIDVMWLAGGVTYQAIDEGLVSEIDASNVPNYQYIPESIGREKLAAPVGIAVVQLMHNKDVFAKKGWAPLTSWFDLWDPKYKGHVGLQSINISVQTAFLVNLAKVLSGDPKNMDAAFAKMQELRPNMLDFYNATGALETAFQQGDLWVGILSGQRAWQLKNSGMPIGYEKPKESIPGYQTWAGVVKNCPHPKAAYAWVNYLLSVEGQQRIADVIGYTPVNSQVIVPPENQLYFPDLKDVFIPDWRYISKQLPSYVERWNREIER
jgi:putative spermidine/putrescine transport system substrate-binding protein